MPRQLLLLLAVAAIAPAIIATVAHLSGMQSSAASRDAVPAFLRLWAYAAFFGLCLWAFHRRPPGHNLQLSLLAGCVIYATAAYLAARLIGDLSQFSGPFDNRNGFASFLGMGLIAGVTYLARPDAGSDYMRFATVLGACGIVAMALLSTQSRLGISASFVGILVGLLLVSRQHVTARLWLTMCAGLALLGFFGSDILARFSQTAEDIATRLELYRQVGALILERPLTGFGPDSFARIFEQAHQPPLPLEAVWDRAHSTYLQLWLENGLIAGSALPLAGAMALVIVIRRSAERSRAAPAAAAGALVLAAVHSIADFSFENHANALFLLCIVALGMSSTQRPEQVRESQDP